MQIEELNNKIYECFDTEKVDKAVVVDNQYELSVITYGFRHKYGSKVEEQACDMFWDKVFSKYKDTNTKIYLRKPFIFQKQDDMCKIVCRLATPNMDLVHDLAFCMVKEGHRFGLCKDFQLDSE